MNKNPQCNQQNKSENEEMCIFTKTWKVVVTQHQHLKMWVQCQKESQATISVSSHVQ